MVEQLTLNQRVAGSSPARFTTITNVYAGICIIGVLDEGSKHLGSIKVPLLARLGGFRVVHELTAYREIGAVLLHLFHRIQQLLRGDDVVPVKY